MPIPSLQTLWIDGLPPAEFTRERSWPSDFGGWNYAHSLVLVCPRCLARWAVLAFDEEDMHPQGVYCEHHGDGRLIHAGGAIDHPLLNALPEALLRREFELTLKELER